jgi:CSLREA domain-containing protein
MRSRPIRCWAIGVALGIASGSIRADAGPTFVVNTIADVAASAPLDDGVCETEPGNGECTLRAAIQEANHSPSLYPLVRVPAGTYVLTIPPSAADNEATGDLVLTGTTIVEGAAPSATGIVLNYFGSAYGSVFYTAGTAAVIRSLSVSTARALLPDEAGSAIVNQGVCRSRTCICSTMKACPARPSSTTASSHCDIASCGTTPRNRSAAARSRPSVARYRSWTPC